MDTVFLLLLDLSVRGINWLVTIPEVVMKFCDKLKTWQKQKGQVRGRNQRSALYKICHGKTHWFPYHQTVNHHYQITFYQHLINKFTFLSLLILHTISRLLIRDEQKVKAFVKADAVVIRKIFTYIYKLYKSPSCQNTYGGKGLLCFARIACL